MNKSIKFLLVAVAAISMASCSTGYYLSNSQNVNLSQTQVVLSQANFQVVKQVKVTYVYKNLHSMRFNASQMKESAYAALVKEAKLTGAQTLINVTMEQVQRKSQNFWTYVLGFPPKYEQAIIVSGTVIEFLPAGVTPTNSDVIESYLYGDPISGHIVSESSTNSSNTVTTITTQNFQNKPILNDSLYSEEIQDVDKYTLVEQKYITDVQFFAIYKGVRSYLLSNNRNAELVKIDNYLLTASQKDINALMYEVKRNSDIKFRVNKFIKYANM
ncbi:MAG: DUF6567 family protein [Paludibacteraceae bacterium]|nr:DUF6567 family protein [Paludibacteraceae bacterium]